MNETTLECDTAAQPGSIPLSQVRIGAVSYLNSKPLIAGLQDELAPGHLLLDVPSRLADDLSAGELDVALIPSVEFFSRPDYRIISDACIATRGPVLSVKLYSRVPLGEIRTLALDEGSRTSAVLSRIMLKERFGVIPERKLLPMSSSTTDSDADAILLIGDRAINPPQEKFLETWDLGEEWVNWTGFPFVFAMWVARSSVEMEQVAELLEEARDLGVKSISEIARREAGPLHISVETAEHYLRENLHFQFGSAEWRGLNLFRQLASQLENPDPFAVGSLT